MGAKEAREVEVKCREVASGSEEVEHLALQLEPEPSREKQERPKKGREAAESPCMVAECQWTCRVKQASKLYVVGIKQRGGEPTNKVGSTSAPSGRPGGTLV